jgi:hypothetical protein
MPKIDKNKRNLPVAIKATKKKTSTKKSSRVKQNPIDYYKCLTNMAQAGFPDKITACCKNCKMNAPALNVARQKELQE